jgi:hypothetical protein
MARLSPELATRRRQVNSRFVVKLAIVGDGVPSGGEGGDAAVRERQTSEEHGGQ